MTAGLAFPEGPLVAWYGDDFTGAASVLEVLEFNGIASVLFLSPPNPALLARFSARRGIGIAGDARTRGLGWMRAELPTVFACLRATGAKVVQYKICSTLDSAPALGSIGCAAEIANSDCAPLVIGSPRIGRWQAFGTLFAQSEAGIVRLDRHPTMAIHPATPMDEADVRLHLARQTDLPIGLVDLVDLKSGQGAAVFDRAKQSGARIVTFDVIDDETLIEIGRLIWAKALQAQLFCIGSQGLQDALVAAWAAVGHRARAPVALQAIDKIAVISGSCSRETEGLIARATAAGFIGLRVDAAAAVSADLWQQETDRLQRLAVAALTQGRSPILFTAMGPADPALKAAATARGQRGLTDADANASLGRGLGGVLVRLIAKTGLRQVAIAGGARPAMPRRRLGLLP